MVPQEAFPDQDLGVTVPLMHMVAGRVMVAIGATMAQVDYPEVSAGSIYQLVLERSRHHLGHKVLVSISMETI